MEDTVPILINITFVFFLVLANGYFVAAEFAIVRSRPTKLREPEVRSQFGVESSLRLIEELDLSLSATQLGITVVSLVLGWFGEKFFASLFHSAFLDFGEPFAFFATHAFATACALIVVTFLHVVVGELAAKSLAIRYPEMTLRVVAPSMVFLTKTCRPVIYVLNGSANLFLRIFGLRTVAESERVHTSTELRMLIAHSGKYGALDKAEEEMLKGIFTFSETVAREIMTHRTDVVVIDHDATLSTILDTITKSGFSRFPVVGESVDEVRGILLARDILPYFQRPGESLPPSFELSKLMRQAYFIPGTKQIDDLLGELRSRNVHMAIILDEHGGVDGVVTLEDILEEIVGDIFDESDRLEEDFVESENGDILIDGGVLVSDINERFELKLAEGDYDTIAGFMLNALGRTSVTGDSVLINSRGRVVAVNSEPVNFNGTIKDGEHHNSGEHEDSEDNEMHQFPETLLKVETVDGNRIGTVRLHIIYSKEEATGELADGSNPSTEEEEVATRLSQNYS
jgi:CBS domain containing-hemolysin-like protein